MGVGALTVAHILLAVVAATMAAEALWAMTTPLVLRDRMQRMLDETLVEPGTTRTSMWVAALLFWAVAWFGQQWAHRTLFIIGVLAMILGFLAPRVDLLRWWYDHVLAKRSPWTIRLLYSVELAVAAALLWVALSGR